MDLAASIQKVTEDVVSRLALTARRELNADYLCLAGGVALNCVANGRLLREGTFRDIWIQPAAGDAGGAIGAALAGWHLYGDAPREVDGDDRMRGSFLGPSFGEAEIKNALDRAGARYRRLPEAEMLESVAASLAEGAVVGWFQGRMEFGPRALGNRSILGDPRNSKMQSVMNLKIKYRESFRPFAPAVLVERTADYFELDRPSPYMGLVAKVREELRQPMSDEQQSLFGIDKLNVPRSSIPAVTHVDYSARIQSVDARTNPRFHRLIERFAARTGCAVLVNTSFNVRGEPIVCTPEDAYRCFMRTEMDVLVIGDFVLAKAEQPERPRDESWKREFELD
jgi:carbamoyltransferase